MRKLRLKVLVTDEHGIESNPALHSLDVEELEEVQKLAGRLATECRRVSERTQAFLDSYEPFSEY